jgi:pyrroline-5-carboxylate reductase
MEMEKCSMGIKVGMIGTGNIGTPLIKGVVHSGVATPEDIYIFDVDRSKAEALSKETGVRVAKDNRELVRNCDYIMLAIKPAFVKPVLEEIREEFGPDKVLVSIAAGVTTKTLKAGIGEDRKVVRTMPNLPVLVGEGMTLICFGDNLSEEEKAAAKSLFAGSGKVEELEERLMSEVIALTGSSPAYVFIMIEAMADGAVQAGLPRKLSYKLAAQAVLGSAKMVLDTGLHPADLKDQVCSPAGTTIDAVQALEKNGFRYLIMNAMQECTRRALEIGRAAEGR